MKRVLSLVLSILLLCGCGPAERVGRSYMRAEYIPGQRHGQTIFDDMVLTYPEPDAVIEALDRALKSIDASADPESFITTYEKQAKAYNDIVSAASLAYVRY